MAIGYRIADGYLEITADTDKADREILQFFRSTDGKLRDMKGRFASEGNLAGRGFARELERGAGSGGGGKGGGLFGGILSKMAGFGRTAGGLFVNGLMAKVVLGLGALPSVLSTAAAAAQGAMQIGGAVAALAPAAIGAAATMIGTLKLAFSGLGDAFKAGLSGDMQKFAEATKNMAPAMQSAVREMLALAPAARALKQEVQQNFWSQFSGDIKAIGLNYLPILRNAMGGVATAFGQSAGSIAQWLLAAPQIAAMGAAFSDIKEALSNIAAGLPGIVQGLVTLFTTGADFLPGLTGGFDQLTQRFADWMAMLADTGRLQSFISGGLSLVGDLIKLFEQLGGIVSGIFGAVPDTGSGLLGLLTQLATAANTFINSFQGQEILGQFFEKLAAIGQIVMQLVGAAMPGLMAFSGALIQGLNALLPAAKPVGEALAAIMEAIAPLLPVIGGVLATGLQLLATMLSAIGAELGPLIGLFSQLVTGVLGQFAPVISAWATEALPPVIEAGKQLAASFAPLIPVVIRIAQAISGQLLAAMPELLSLAQQAIPIFLEVGQTLASTLMDGLTMIEPHLPLLVGMFVALLKVIVVIGDVFIQFLPIIVGVFSFFVQAIVWVADFVLTIAEIPFKILAAKDAIMEFVSGAWDSLVGFFTGIIDWFTALPGQIWGFISSLPATIGQIFSDLANQSLYWIGYAVGSILKFFMDLPGQIWGFISSLPSIIGNAFSSAWEWAKNATSTAIDAVINFVTNLPTRAANILGGLWGAISGAVSSAWNSLKSATSSAIDATVNFVKDLPGKIKSVFSGALGWLKDAGSDMIHGLANGIEDALGWAVQKAKDAASRIAKGFKDALGIGSPSKVMAQQVGRWIPPGIQQGIQSAMPALTGYVEGAARGLTTAAMAPTVNVAAPSVAVGGATVTLLVDGDEIAAKIVTPERTAAATAEGSRRRSYLNTGRPAVVGGVS